MVILIAFIIVEVILIILIGLSEDAYHKDKKNKKDIQDTGDKKECYSDKE